MDYKIEFKKSADKEFSKLEKSIQKRIFDFLKNKVAKDPHLLKESLHGNKKGLWKYRVGEYRIICEIKNQQLVVLVISIGHRKEVYK